MILLSQRQLHTSRAIVNQQLQQLKEMQEYCEATTCRRNVLVEHFGETCKQERLCDEEGCQVCDNCLKHCSHKFCIIRALSRAQQGDVETGLVFSGNNMRKVDRIMQVKDIFAQLKQQVAEID